jgi:hypothetical protein
MEQVDFHVELETHDVISAEGAWSETFVDDDSRGMFHNADEYAELYPKDVRHDARYCAPRLDAGHKVEAIRRRIAERAGLACASPTVGALRGALDRVSARTAVGWAQNPDQPETPVCLDIYLDDALIGQTLANHYRGDLEQAGLGTGRHAFEFTAPDGVTLLPAKLTVRRSLDGAILAQAPTSRSVMAAAA